MLAEPVDPVRYHRLYGQKRPRLAYHRNDFLDYVLMITLSAGVACACYGPRSALAVIAVSLCVFMIAVFPVRHGVGFRTPLILRRPQDVFYMLVYKVQNAKGMYFLAAGLLLTENVFIWLTPDLPHHVALMRQCALGLFYLHFISISAYRAAILVAHLRKKEKVREILLQTAWKHVLSRNGNITLEIVHAYMTGMLAHLVLIAPWYFVITHASYSIIALPLVCAIDVYAQLKFTEVINAWFYRDHWLGHNSELEFVYLHGTHHDAIPCGLIGVAGNGYLEGFLRHVLGFPNPFYHPLPASVFYTLEIKQDIETHQYIPGIFPKLSRQFQEITQHSTHHFGRLEPYGFGIKLDHPAASQELRAGFRRLPEQIKNSIGLDERLTGFQWDNSRHRAYLELVDKYQNQA
jgi:hypothetical protein